MQNEKLRMKNGSHEKIVSGIVISEKEYRRR